MNPRWLAVLSLLLILVVACGGDGNNGPLPTDTSAPAGPTLPPFPTQAARPSPTPVPSHPAGTRTGVEVIDRALDAIDSVDPAALEASLSFHPYRCDNAPAGTDGSNLCPPGVAEGSAVDVIALGGCDVSFIARESPTLAQEVGAFTRAAAAQGVYAVTEVQEGRLASPLPLRYLVIFAEGFAMLLDDAGVTHLGLPCEGVGPAELYHPADRPVLEPL